ncbi:MAG: UvrD-helicase domain-containing protein, partial [Pseudomonadota bacterium]
MRTPDQIPPDALRFQREVSDPGVSAWVAANAGSGKTHVLAQRVINLLLGGVKPEKILCLTFTKAAAANMAKRVFETLARWTTLDDAVLEKAIRDQSHLVPDAIGRAAARRLFSQALEAPGGLKVQTIHAFCAKLLHRFPFEANVSARFSVLDTTEQAQLLEHLTLAVLLDGAADPSGRLGRALATAMTAAADQTFRELVREAIGRRDAISRFVISAHGVDRIGGALSRALDIDASDNRQSIDANFFSGALIEPAEWTPIAAILARGANTDREQARRFEMLGTLSASDRVE